MQERNEALFFDLICGMWLRAGDGDFIATVRGVGYRFEDEEM